LCIAIHANPSERRLPYGITEVHAPSLRFVHVDTSPSIRLQVDCQSNKLHR